MQLEETETIKYLFDHIKSMWTLSAGGLAFGVGVLGFMSKDALKPAWLHHSIQFAIVASLVSYLISVMAGLNSHKRLIEAVLKSELGLGNSNETATEGDATEAAKEPGASVEQARSQLAWSKGAFIAGGGILVASTMFFIAWETLSPKAASGEIEIALKNATMFTPDSREIRIQDISFRLVEMGVEEKERRRFEIKDLKLKAELKQNKP
ncbi:MAG: hypothetical protein QOG23_1776 [Blastocatellia bacterium]|jgi:ABC-type multidrug transport system fused ATPase/permease subunit|nr:hypothetical protein [Blastocatellia bacterium]